MARKRTIDPDLWTDDRVQQLPSLLAVLLYIGSISHADDEGRLEWNARQLYAKVFPVRDDVKIRDVEAAMTAIVDSGLVEAYTVGARAYAAHPSWRKHQYVNRPSKSRIPAPPRETDLEVSHLHSLSDSVSNTVEAVGSPPVLTEDSVRDSVSPHVPSESESESESGDTPESANADSAPQGGRRVRPQPEPVEFDEPDEARVGSVVAITASENKTGTIAVGRVATIRGDLRRLLDEHGAEAWRYGLDEAIRRGKGAAYAAAIVKAAAKRLAAGNALTVTAPPNGRSRANDFGYARSKG